MDPVGDPDALPDAAYKPAPSIYKVSMVKIDIRPLLISLQGYVRRNHRQSVAHLK